MSRPATLTVENPYLFRRVLGEPKGEADRFPLLTPRFDWLRGLDLNQRPLGYEYNMAMTGNPLILREKRSTARSSTFSVDASFLLLFRPVSGCYGMLWEQN